MLYWFISYGFKFAKLGSKRGKMGAKLFSQRDQAAHWSVRAALSSWTCALVYFA